MYLYKQQPIILTGLRTIFLVCLLMNIACQKPEVEFDEYVFAVQLIDNDKKVEEYLNYHKQVWPEVEESFKKAGYEKIRLYRFGNFISMIVRVPKGSDLEKLGMKAESSHAKVKQWNNLMTTYQKGLPGVKSGTTWVMMDKIYEFDRDGQ